MKVLIFQVVSYFYYKRAKVKGLMYKDKDYSQQVAESTMEDFPTLNKEIIDMDFDTCVKKSQTTPEKAKTDIKSNPVIFDTPRK